MTLCDKAKGNKALVSEEFNVYSLCRQVKEQRGNDMGKKTALLLIVGVLGAYYLYIPLPDNVDEPWRVNCHLAAVKIMIDLVSIEFN